MFGILNNVFLLGDEGKVKLKYMGDDIVLITGITEEAIIEKMQ